MENVEISKVVGINKLPGRYLKDGAKILTKSVSEICSLSISHGIFPVKLQNSKVRSRNSKKLINKLLRINYLTICIYHS